MSQEPMFRVVLFGCRRSGAKDCPLRVLGMNSGDYGNSQINSLDFKDSHGLTRAKLLSFIRRTASTAFSFCFLASLTP